MIKRLFNQKLKLKSDYFKYIAVLLVFIAIAVGSMIYFNNKNSINKTPVPSSAATSDINLTNIAATLKQQLNADESWGTPVIMPIADTTKLKELNPQLFETAQTSDLILAFKTKKLFVIFRPSTNSVVNFAPLTE
jgi:hypothetical protein